MRPRRSSARLCWQDPKRPSANLLIAQILLKRPAPSDDDERRGRPGDEPATHWNILTGSITHRPGCGPGPALAREGPVPAGEAGRGRGRLGRGACARSASPDAGWGLLEIYYLETEPTTPVGSPCDLTKSSPTPTTGCSSSSNWSGRMPSPRRRVARGVVRAGGPTQSRRAGPALALGLALVRDGDLDRGPGPAPPGGRGPSREPLAPGRPGLPAWTTAARSMSSARPWAGSPLAGRRSPTSPGSAGRVAQERQDWKAAAPGVPPRPSRDPRDAKLGTDSPRAPPDRDGRGRAARSRLPGLPGRRREVRRLYEEANAIKTLGIEPHPDLYRRLADLRERMGLGDEARAWYRLALRDQPNDSISRAGILRLARPDVLGRQARKNRPARSRRIRDRKIRYFFASSIHAPSGRFCQSHLLMLGGRKRAAALERGKSMSQVDPGAIPAGPTIASDSIVPAITHPAIRVCQPPFGWWRWLSARPSSPGWRLGAWARWRLTVLPPRSN